MNPTGTLDLRGKRVLVTGGASGIGFATARILSELGAQVVITDISEAALDAARTETGARAAMSGDVALEADCERLAAAAATALGGLDALVHAAGVNDNVVKALDVDIDQWQRVVDITLRGTFLMCRAVARIMLPQGGGSIVNISSVVGLAGIPRRYAYSPAKAAVAMLTQDLACEWSRVGIRVNSVAPGYVRTPMVGRLVQQGKIDEATLRTRIPADRLGEPEEIARASAFLISDWASYVSGAVLPVDGGWMAYGGAGNVATA